MHVPLVPPFHEIFSSQAPACENPHCEVHSKHPTLSFAHLKLCEVAQVLHRADERFFRASCLVRARLGHDRNSHQTVFLVLGKPDHHSNQDAARPATIRGEAPCAGDIRRNGLDRSTSFNQSIDKSEIISVTYPSC